MSDNSDDEISNDVLTNKIPETDITGEDDFPSQIKLDIDLFLKNQNQIEKYKLKIKELLKDSKESRKNILNFMEKSHRSELLVGSYLFQRGIKQKFSCPEKKFDEFFSNDDKQQFIEDKEFSTVKKAK